MRKGFQDPNDMNRKHTLAIIPARGGSKGIYRKNISIVGGKPLLAWTVVEALSAKCIDRVVVSTDDDETARIALQLGAEVPFLRPHDLSGDRSLGIDVAYHALEWLEVKEGYFCDYIVYLQPTSPLRTAQDIESAFQMALDRSAEAVISVTPAVQHLYLLRWIDESGCLMELAERPEKDVQRQMLPDLFSLNGAIYLVSSESLHRKRSWYPERTYAYVMPNERSLDVDTSWDLYLADLILRDRATRSLL